MEELLNYSKYEHLICICLESPGDIYMSTSSNRKINVSYLKNIRSTDTVNKELKLSVGSIFPTYFKLQSKDNSQLTETDKLTLSSILNYFMELRLELSRNNRISLDARQIVFMLPVDWIDKDRQAAMLRTLFLEAGWITPEDDNNKLMVVPFIETFIGCLQKTTDGRLQFGREKKYILFSVFQTDNWKNISYNCTSFQMQSAKELITVSKKLASSEFLLVPTVLKSQSIKMLDLDHALRAAIKEILTAMQIRQRKKAQCVTNEEDEQKREVSEIASVLADNLPEIHSRSDDHTKVVSDFVKGVDLNVYQLQELSNLSCYQFVKEISLNANVQAYTGEIVAFMRNFRDEYGTLSHSPDGIQDTVLHYGAGDRGHYIFYINEALIQAKLVKPGSGLIHTPIPPELVKSGMQRPMKMVQIANAIKPPVILNEEDIGNEVYSKTQEISNSLLPLNSFYLQITIGEQQIDFTLNKVVKEPSSKNTAQLFTIQQREIRKNNIVDIALDKIWDHYQLLESEGHLGLLSNCCQEHDTLELSARHYKCFNSNIKKLIEAWCQCKDTCTNEELDAYHPVYIDLHCTCALKITRRMLLEMGLTPAIINIGALIVGAAFSNGYFGLYPISAIIIRKWMISVVNPYYSRTLERLLQEALRKGFQTHYRDPRLFFESDSDDIVTQYLGTGAYSQTASTTFAVKFEIMSKMKKYNFGLYDEHHHLCQSLAVRTKKAFRWGHNLMSDYITILRSGSWFPPAGITKTFFFKEGKQLRIGIYTLQSSPHGTFYCEIGNAYIADLPKGYCLFSANILPEHYTSSIKISQSYITTSKETAYYKEISVNFYERLHLKRQ